MIKIVVLKTIHLLNKIVLGRSALPDTLQNRKADFFYK